MNEDVANLIKSQSSGDLNSFIQNYRQALEDQYSADVNTLENQRKLDQTSIMSGANVRGMLHSNFPTRAKLQYDVNTYEPNLVKLRQGYQTGLDSLYSNVASYANQIKSIQEKIADLNAA